MQAVHQRASPHNWYGQGPMRPSNLLQSYSHRGIILAAACCCCCCGCRLAIIIIIGLRSPSLASNSDSTCRRFSRFYTAAPSTKKIILCRFYVFRATITITARHGNTYFNLISSTTRKQFLQSEYGLVDTGEKRFITTGRVQRVTVWLLACLLAGHLIPDVAAGWAFNYSFIDGPNSRWTARILARSRIAISCHDCVRQRRI